MRSNSPAGKSCCSRDCAEVSARPSCSCRPPRALPTRPRSKSGALSSRKRLLTIQLPWRGSEREVSYWGQPRCFPAGAALFSCRRPGTTRSVNESVVVFLAASDGTRTNIYLFYVLASMGFKLMSLGSLNDEHSDYISIRSRNGRFGGPTKIRKRGGPG